MASDEEKAGMSGQPPVAAAAAARGRGRDLASFDAPAEAPDRKGFSERVVDAWHLLDAGRPGTVARSARQIARRLGLPLGPAARRRAAALADVAARARAFHAAGKPTVLLVSHDWGGGVDRHLRDRMAALAGSTSFLMLTPRGRRVELSVPGPDAPAPVSFGPRDLDELIGVLRQFPLARVHVHHVVGFAVDVKPVIDGLGLPFDFTVHDYFTLCPRISMVTPWDMRFCGEPPPEGCNRCIASGEAPPGGRVAIEAHRARYRWLLAEAAQVICPSDDVRQRLARYGVTARVITRPHEPPQAALPKPLRRLAPGAPLRIALLGSLAPHKGLWRVRDTVLAARGLPFAFHLIGATDPPLALPADAAFSETGPYAERELAAFIAASEADVLWFPSVAPETYSYTLSAALAAGRPIVASDRGAFRDRLAGRDWCWLAPPEASADEMLALFGEVAGRLSDGNSVRTD